VKDGRGAYFPRDIPISDGAKDFIAKLLNSNPIRRLTADEALDHPWLNYKNHSTDLLPAQVLNGLKQLNGSNKFMKIVLMNLGQKLFQDSKEKRQELLSSFEKLDKDNSGRVTIDELKTALKLDADSEYVMDEVRCSLFADLDLDGSKTMHYKHLVAVATLRYLVPYGVVNEERINDSWKRMDKKRIGTLTAKDLSGYLSINEEQAKALVEQLDRNNDGRVSYDEYLQLFKELVVQEQVKPPKTKEDEQSDVKYVVQDTKTNMRETTS
jgi:calcium-dependent protein kinase